jgi:hypothetical protein
MCGTKSQRKESKNVPKVQVFVVCDLWHDFVLIPQQTGIEMPISPGHQGVKTRRSVLHLRVCIPDGRTAFRADLGCDILGQL